MKATLGMPGLRKWAIFRLTTDLYIRCCATNYKAWLMPGICPFPEWLTQVSLHYVLIWLYSITKLLQCFVFLLRQPTHMSSYKKSVPGVAERTLYQTVNFKDPMEFPVLLKYNKRFKLYRTIPKRAMSRLWGDFNRLTLPVWLRPWAFRLYIWMFGCKPEEAEYLELKEYRNLRDFFTRRLKPGVRHIHGKLPLVSPSDGHVLYCGKVTDDTLEQIKGVQYTMQTFMGPLSSPVFDLNNQRTSSYFQKLVKNPKHELRYCIIYLAPGDYHRFHSPADWTVHSRRHFYGELFSVNPHIARWLQGLFCINERAMYIGEWKYGFFAFTAVGATNVGSIHTTFDEDLETNTRKTGQIGCYVDKTFRTRKKRGINIKKGQDIGHFNLGSTIVLIFETPQTFRLNLRPEQRVKYGQGIGGCLKHFN